MNRQKIAVLTDSCTDIPREYIEKYGIYVLPLAIQYSYGTFLDGVDITAQQVYDTLEDEVPKTSLPPGGVVIDKLIEIERAGYEKLLVITISSALSGTLQAIKMMTENISSVDCRFIDTRNVSMGAGFTVLRAAELIERGMDIDEIERRLNSLAARTRVFFCVETLEYLKKGGRLGAVSAAVGSLLGIRPIISCKEDGIYTVQKARGRTESLNMTIKLADDYARGYRYNLAVAYGGSPADAERVIKHIPKLVAGAKLFAQFQVSPVLGVHTGPGLLGIGVQRLGRLDKA